MTLHDLLSSEPPPLVSIIYLDPPEHERLRNLVSRVFTPRAITALEPMIRQVVRETLDTLRGRTEFDAVADFAALFPVEVISATLGVPPADRQAVRLRTDALLHREPNDPAPTPAGVEAGGGSTCTSSRSPPRSAGNPGDDLITRLCQAELPGAHGPERLTDGEIAGFATLWRGRERNGDQADRQRRGAVPSLAAEWAKVVADPGRIPSAAEEILRDWAPSQYQGRFSRGPVTFHGVTIPEGVPVLLLTGAASRDERAYPDPDRFDIDREQDIVLGFGYGIYSCLGAALARLESRIAFEELPRALPPLRRRRGRSSSGPHGKRGWVFTRAGRVDGRP